MALGTEVGLGAGHLVLDGGPNPLPQKRGVWLPVSATAELLLAKLQVLLWARCPPVTQPRRVKTLKGTEVLMPAGEDQPLASSFVEPQPDSREKKIAPLPVSFKMVKNSTSSFCS